MLFVLHGFSCRLKNYEVMKCWFQLPYYSFIHINFLFEISTAKLMFSEKERVFDLNFRILFKYLQAAGRQAKGGRGRKPRSYTTPWYIILKLIIIIIFYNHYYYYFYFLFVTKPSFNTYLINTNSRNANDNKIKKKTYIMYIIDSSIETILLSVNYIVLIWSFKTNAGILPLVFCFRI